MSDTILKEISEEINNLNENLNLLSITIFNLMPKNNIK